jgi:ParB-like chromosome segregation protein Spo0J
MTSNVAPARPYAQHVVTDDPFVDDLAQRVALRNQLAREAQARLPWDDPVGAVQWVPLTKVGANDYNPNAVAHHEMKLLHTSIEQDGFTQPIVCIYDSVQDRYVIVDGFHRWTVARNYPEIAARTHGYVPVVVLDKPLADRIASTVRHNRARGKHSVQGMGSLVFQLLGQGESDTDICNKIGLEAEELARLKHVTGYSKLYADAEYSRPLLTTAQQQAKATYQREHPDEHVPTEF